MSPRWIGQRDVRHGAAAAEMSGDVGELDAIEVDAHERETRHAKSARSGGLSSSRPVGVRARCRRCRARRRPARATPAALRGAPRSALRRCGRADDRVRAARDPGTVSRAGRSAASARCRASTGSSRRVAAQTPTRVTTDGERRARRGAARCCGAAGRRRVSEIGCPAAIVPPAPMITGVPSTAVSCCRSNLRRREPHVAAFLAITTSDSSVAGNVCAISTVPLDDRQSTCRSARVVVPDGNGPPTRT